jgi:hypothetical protein
MMKWNNSSQEISIGSSARTGTNRITSDSISPKQLGFVKGPPLQKKRLTMQRQVASSIRVGGGVYLTAPKSGRTSDSPLGLSGCMSCGDENHRFSECKSRSEVAAREKFYANFNDHRDHIANARLKREAEKTESTGGNPVKTSRTGSHYRPSHEDRSKRELEQIKAACGHTQVSERHALPSPRNNDHHPMQYRNCNCRASVITGHAEKEFRRMPMFAMSCPHSTYH